MPICGLQFFADVGVMILAVLNAIRALFVKKRQLNGSQRLHREGVKFWNIDMKEFKSAYEAEAKKRGFKFDPTWQKAVDQVIAETK